jgi:hypothetical protein
MQPVRSSESVSRISEAGRPSLHELDKLSLANCHFAHDSSGFPILLPFCDVRFARRSHPPLYIDRCLTGAS